MGTELSIPAHCEPHATLCEQVQAHPGLAAVQLRLDTGQLGLLVQHHLLLQGPLALRLPLPVLHLCTNNQQTALFITTAFVGLNTEGNQSLNIPIPARMRVERSSVVTAGTGLQEGFKPQFAQVPARGSDPIITLLSLNPFRLTGSSGITDTG